MFFYVLLWIKHELLQIIAFCILFTFYTDLLGTDVVKVFTYISMSLLYILILSTLEPIIRFLDTKFSVNEPKEASAVATVKIPVVRVGDTSKVSVVRVHTKDGSAVSGEDYYPVSQGKSHIYPLMVWYD